MARIRNIWLVGALAGALFCCSSDDEGGPADGAVDLAATVDVVTGNDVTTTPDQRTDAVSATAPRIIKLVPDDGFADGGPAGKTSVLIVGENLQPNMTIYLDSGAAEIITISHYVSPTSVRFDMPADPYIIPPDDQYIPRLITVHVRAGDEDSNFVDFQYIVVDEMSATQKGSVLSSSTPAYRNFESAPIEGQVLIEGMTDTTDNTAPALLKAEVGLAAVGENPTESYAFQWFPATYVRDEGDYDVFVGTVLPLAAETTFDIAYRFSKDGGGTWIYADSDEGNLAYQTSAAAKLQVQPPPRGYCAEALDCIDLDAGPTCHTFDAWGNNYCGP